MKSEYKHRVIDEIQDFYLDCIGAVLIEGPARLFRCADGGCIDSLIRWNFDILLAQEK